MAEYILIYDEVNPHLEPVLVERITVDGRIQERVLNPTETQGILESVLGFPPENVPFAVVGPVLGDSLAFDGTDFINRPNEVFNVTDYGAIGGGADDTTAFTTAITAAAASGGIVFVPTGTYLVSGNLGGALSNVTIQGAGRFVSIIKLKNSSDTHVFDISGNNWTMRDIGVDGNDAGNSSGHGIRITGDHHTLDTLYIHDTVGYGIASAQGASDILRYATYTNLYIKNTGVDGIDIKDHLSSNTGNRLTNITIDGIDISATGDCAGIDCRGPVQLANITCDFTTHGSANGSGIRFRENSPTTGPVGGLQSTLTNARIVGDDTTSMYGVGINAQGVSISNVYVNNIWRAFTVGVDAAQVALVNCVAEDANSRGFEIATTSNEDVSLSACRALDCATGFYVTSNDVNLIGCISRDATTAGFDIRGDRVQIRGGRVTAGAGTAVSINASADGTQITGLDFSQQSAGTKLSNSGTSTLVRDCVSVSAVGTETFAAGTATAAPLKLTAGTLLTTPEAGVVNYDGTVFYTEPAASVRGLLPSVLYVRNDATTSLPNDTNANPIFASANDALTVVAGLTYRFRCAVRLTTGNTSCTVSFVGGGTATYTTVNYLSVSTAGASGTSGTASINNGEAFTAVTVVNASTALNKRFILEGEFEVNAGGTLIPQIQFSVDPTGTCTANVGSFFEAWRVGGNPVTAIGPWA